MQINMKEYNFLHSFKEKDLYTWDEIIAKIEDLECELKAKEEELEDLKEDVESNYTPTPVSTQVGINNNDFI